MSYVHYTRWGKRVFYIETFENGMVFYAFSYTGEDFLFKSQLLQFVQAH